MRALLVEDDSLLGSSLVAALRHAGYVVDWRRTLRDARLAAETAQYGIALIDRQLPDGEGLDLITALRDRDPRIGIVALTARDAVRDRVAGLDRGADDYLVKPFDLDELLARMRAASRRSCERDGAEILVGSLRVDVQRRLVWSAEQQIDLPARTFDVLLELVRSQGRILSRRQLEEALYPAGEEVESNAIEVHIHHLRRRLGKQLIRTVRGVGYTIDTGDASQS